MQFLKCKLFNEATTTCSVNLFILGSLSNSDKNYEVTKGFVCK